MARLPWQFRTKSLTKNIIAADIIVFWDISGDTFSSPELAQYELLGYRDVRRTCGRL